MTEQGELIVSTQSLPTKAWIRFLRTYGPTPNNKTMFDEHVAKAARRVNVEPIKLETPLVDEILNRIRSGSGSIVIAGTAGDGKTYHSRSVWASLGGSDADWANASSIKHLRLDNKNIYFVKDLSELNDDKDNNFVMECLERSVLQNDDQQIVVIAANHGQILERLRARSYQGHQQHPLRKFLEQVFLQTGEGHFRLKVYDLSRNSHRRSLLDVVDVLINNPEWGKCKHCHIQLSGKICPIFENRQRLLGQTDTSKVLRQRVGDLIDLARLDGAHLPIRDLLALSSNIILGHPDAKDGLLHCEDVAKIQKNGTLSEGNLYDNIVGVNLKNNRVTERPLFKAIASFQIGVETTGQVDGLLIYGQYDPKLLADYDRLVSSDLVYGAPASFRSAQENYLEGDENARDQHTQQFIRLLRTQRRRLFFTMPKNEFRPDYFWSLSSFQYAGYYLSLLRSLQSKSSVEESIRQLIVRGINRIMTGQLVDNTDQIFIATSGGFTQSKVSMLCQDVINSRRKERKGMAIKINENGRPYLDLRLVTDDPLNITFELTPTRFEFLARAAAGALPSSFSSECLEDVLALKARLLRRVERLQQIRIGDDGDDDIDENSLSLGFLEIEMGGQGLAREILVRLPK